MQGDDLHGGGVAVQPADALGADVGRGLVDAAPQPLDQRGQAEAVRDGGGVQRLADVPQVGQLPLAARWREQPGAAGRARSVATSSSAATPRSAQHVGPAAQRSR